MVHQLSDDDPDRRLELLTKTIEDEFGNLEITFQQVGAPIYGSVRRYLDEEYRGPIEWPARSPELTFRFFPVGYLKSKVSATEPDSIDVLQKPIVEESSQFSIHLNEYDKNLAVGSGLEQNSRIPTVFQAAAYRYPRFQVVAARSAWRGRGDCEAKQVPYLFSPLKVVY
ncbi:hypothetical protein NQ318_015321 [Aromia moschata]|uniref:Uncharacterized protein n=1 Tax=Aromia moschata TaxID=1265417 RepID=A0AAV8XXP7_9CUCU|nr:hypothetical protein NQ318_015321 [Aromia moschata]